MSKTVEKLNLYLANLNVLYRKVQNYHWNIVGAGFFSVHAKLEEYYDAINTQIDDVAERILAIGGRPLGTLKDYLEVTTIKEAENKEISIPEAVADVKKDKFIILAGQNYLTPLQGALKHIEIPLEGKKIGERLQFLSNKLK